MLQYSDYILACKPWTYCRLNEPLNHNIYCDMSGNNNHLDTSHIEYKAENQLSHIYTQFKCIKPNILNNTFSINDFDWLIPETALQFKTPIFKSDTIFYRNGKKIQNDLVIKNIWFDCFIDTSSFVSREYLAILELHANYDLLAKIYEPFIAFGPIRILSQTTAQWDKYDNHLIGYYLHFKIFVKYDLSVYNNETEMWEYETAYKETYSKTLVTLNEINDPIDPFLLEINRFTIGIEQLTQNSFYFNICINGETIIQNLIQLEENDIFSITNYEMAIMNETKFSNISFFFNKQYPKPEWFEHSQNSLTQLYKNTMITDAIVINSEIENSIRPEKNQRYNNNIIRFCIINRSITSIYNKK